MRAADDEPRSLRPSAGHDGTDRPRLMFEAPLEKRKARRLVEAGRFRSLCNHIKNHLSRDDFATSRGCRRSAWRGRHAACCTGPLRIITALRWTKLRWCCARRHERQSWSKFEVNSRLCAHRACHASTSCAPPARYLTASVRFPLLRYDVFRLSSLLRHDRRRNTSRLLGWHAVCAICASIAALGLVSCQYVRS